jgi:hypothetical protein
MQEPDGSWVHRYTDKPIERVITQGLDAEGKRLSWVMPRWHMTDRERDDLLADLKTLT